MAGFGLRGIEGFVRCPHCDGTDCAGLGVIAKDGQQHLLCNATGKTVTEFQLKTAAIVAAMKAGSAYLKD